MSKHCVERDLLRIFKRKDANQIVEAIFKMANGTYKYEVPYMNDIPYNEMILYIEKIIVLGTKRTELLTDLQGGLNAIIDFANHIKSIRFSEVDNYSLVSLKYNGRILLEKAKKPLKMVKQAKDNLKQNMTDDRIACLLMAMIILVNLYSMTKDKEKLQGEEVDAPESSIEQTFDREEYLGYDETLGKVPTENIYYEDNYTETMVPQTTQETVPEKTSIDQILEMYSLTEEEFNVVVAIAITESNGTYTDAYAVINTMWNRTISRTWVNYISGFYGQDVGRSLYYQAITPGQFVVYEEGRYLENLNVRKGDAYQAIIDFLLTQETMHDFLSFKSSNTALRDYTQFIDGGNKYHDTMQPEDRLTFRPGL